MSAPARRASRWCGQREKVGRAQPEPRTSSRSPCMLHVTSPARSTSSTTLSAAPLARPVAFFSPGEHAAGDRPPVVQLRDAAARARPPPRGRGPGRYARHLPHPHHRLHRGVRVLGLVLAAERLKRPTRRCGEQGLANAHKWVAALSMVLAERCTVRRKAVPGRYLRHCCPHWRVHHCGRPRATHFIDARPVGNHSFGGANEALGLCMDRYECSWGRGCGYGWPGHDAR